MAGWVLMLAPSRVNSSGKLCSRQRPSSGTGARFRLVVSFILLTVKYSPPGVFEFPAFAEGSTSLLEANIEAAKNGAVVIVGGGDTATVVANHGKESELSHVSTGGGASLELLEGKVSNTTVTLFA